MNHIGTTPFKFKIDVFISYVDVVKTAEEVCVTWERRGKHEGTTVVKVKDKKAVFRETLSMESTLFRRHNEKGKAGTTVEDGEELKFDEKIAKFALRKGGPDGKALGKIHLNLADYVKGTNGTVFADLKLSNGSVVVTKIESTLLRMGKKKKNGSNGGDSDACSEMTDMDGGMEDDSIFGDDAPDHDDLDIMLEEPDSNASQVQTPSKTSSMRQAKAPSPTSSPVSTTSRASSKDGSSPQSASPAPSTTPGTLEPSSSKKSMRERRDTESKSKRDKHKSDGLSESPSIRNKLKSKLKKEKKEKKEAENAESAPIGNSSTDRIETPAAVNAEVEQLRAALSKLETENKKLKAAKQAMMNEIDELRAELEEASETVAEAETSSKSSSNTMTEHKLREENKSMATKIRELESQVEGLLDELEQVNEEEQSSRSGENVRKYERKIEDLETALKREPQYLDVVDELKVTKMALALANMEKEQAIFALKQYEGNMSSVSSPGVEDNDVPVATAW